MVAACAMLAALGTHSWASETMKPGLWEMKMQSDAMKKMPKIPPEQVEQMRRMGMNVPQFEDGGMVTKVCITPQMAAQKTPGMEMMESGCEAKNMQRNASGYKADIVCTGGAMKGEGKMVASFTGNERFSSTYDFKGSMHGQPVSQRAETSGRWIAADCGSVKPLPQ